MYVSMGEFLENTLFFRHTKKIHRQHSLSEISYRKEPRAGAPYWIEQIDMPAWFKEEAERIVAFFILEISRKRHARRSTKREKINKYKKSLILKSKIKITK